MQSHLTMVLTHIPCKHQFRHTERGGKLPIVCQTSPLFFEIKHHYIRSASRLIKNLPVPLGTLVRKIVHKKLAASDKHRYIIYYIGDNKTRGIVVPKVRTVRIKSIVSKFMRHRVSLPSTMLHRDGSNSQRS